MTQRIQAIYDGEVFRPREKVKVPAHTTVELTVSAPAKRKAKPYSLLRAAAAMRLKAPRDFSENLDEYLYHGKPME